MSMFKVYGVTIEAARKKAEKKFDSMPLDFKKGFNTASHEEWVNEEARAFFNKMSPIAISKQLDAPKFAEDFIALAKKTTRCRSLHIRAHIPKVNTKGGVMINPKTKKPKMTWAKWDEVNKKVAA